MRMNTGKIKTTAVSLVLAASVGLPNPALWAQQAKLRATLPASELLAVHSVAFSPDGKTLVSAGFDKTIRFWEVSSGKKVATILDPDVPCSVTFTPDGKTLVSASGKTIELWDVATRKNRATLLGHTDLVVSVAVSPDGRTLASGGADQTIKLWNTNNGKEKATLRGQAGSITANFDPLRAACVRFSPDGKMLASSCHGKNIDLWDITTGKKRSTLRGHENDVYSVAFSPDGKTLASGSYDATVRLWDVATGKNRAILKAYHRDDPSLGAAAGVIIFPGKKAKGPQQDRSLVFSVAFSPDGKTLASGSSAGSIRLWDVGTAKDTVIDAGYPCMIVLSLAFSPDGKTLASASGDGTAKLWDLLPGQQPEKRK